MKRAPIIVALDGMDDVLTAISLIDKIGERVWGFKFNDLYHHSAFHEVVLKCREKNAGVFIDLKLHDIPNTVKNMVQKIVHEHAPNLLTVHASGGTEMMKAAVKAAVTYTPDLCEVTKIVGVTVLTSLDAATCKDIYGAEPTTQVDVLAELVEDADCHAIVCSPKEVKSIKIAFPGLKLIVPGIRPEWYKKADDQSRVGTPTQAIRDGADLLVIGRPITQAENPVEAVEKTAAEIACAQNEMRTRAFVQDDDTDREKYWALDTVGEKYWALDFFEEAGALQFGEFELKSGRKSPYFFNAGMFTKAADLSGLGKMYANVIRHAIVTRLKNRLGEHKLDEIRLVAGPAYKGIPLAISTARALDTEYLFDRKEAKEHGDKGGFVGRLPEKGEKVVIVDDVITTGGTKIEFVTKLKAIGAEPILVVVAMDRMERVNDDLNKSAIDVFQEVTGIPVTALVTLDDMIAWWNERGIGEQGSNIPVYDALMEYRIKYGVK